MFVYKYSKQNCEDPFTGPICKLKRTQIKFHSEGETFLCDCKILNSRSISNILDDTNKSN